MNYRITVNPDSPPVRNCQTVKNFSIFVGKFDNIRQRHGRCRIAAYGITFRIGSTAAVIFHGFSDIAPVKRNTA